MSVRWDKGPREISDRKGKKGGFIVKQTVIKHYVPKSS